MCAVTVIRPLIFEDLLSAICISAFNSKKLKCTTARLLIFVAMRHEKQENLKQANVFSSFETWSTWFLFISKIMEVRHHDFELNCTVNFEIENPIAMKLPCNQDAPCKNSGLWKTSISDVSVANSATEKHQTCFQFQFVNSQRISSSKYFFYEFWADPAKFWRGISTMESLSKPSDDGFRAVWYEFWFSPNTNDSE
jgi:hypothetical protein